MRLTEMSPEDGGSMFLRNVGNHLQDHTALQPRRSQQTSSPPLRPQNLRITGLADYLTLFISCLR
jgi:hypothetical protein